MKKGDIYKVIPSIYNDTDTKDYIGEEVTALENTSNSGLCQCSDGSQLTFSPLELEGPIGFNEEIMEVQIMKNF